MYGTMYMICDVCHALCDVYDVWCVSGTVRCKRCMALRLMPPLGLRACQIDMPHSLNKACPIHVAPLNEACQIYIWHYD